VSFGWVKISNNNYCIPENKARDLNQLKETCLQRITKGGRIVCILDQKFPNYIKEAFSHLGEYSLKDFQKLTWIGLVAQ
jgi:hypothetical protein